MQQNTSIYYTWVPRWLRLILLIIAMFPHLMLMSLFHSNTTFTASFLDIEQEDLQFLLSLMYGSVVIALLVLGRFLAYFRIRSYVILMCSISMILLFLLAHTKDYGLVVVLRTLEGIFGLLEGACFLPLIVAEIKSKHRKTIAYLFLYAIMLTGGTITSSLVKDAIIDFGWSEMIDVVLYFHVFVLIIALLIFNNNRQHRKYPLYQVDYVSCLFLLIALHSGSYAVIYGRKLYWFASQHIVMATCAFLVFSGLFIWKQLNNRRKLFNFEVIQYKNIISGVLLFFLFYIIRSGINNVYSVMATVWNWPWDYIIKVQYFNVAGTVLGVVLSGFLVIKGLKSKYIFAAGFLMLLIDCFWFSQVFTPETTLMTIVPPFFLQGLAQGWLFTPLVLFIVGGVPANLTANAALMGTAVRFWTTNIGFAVIQHFTWSLNQQHYAGLHQHMNLAISPVHAAWQNFTQQFSIGVGDQTTTQLAAAKLFSALNKQALLLSNVEIFKGLAWLAFAVLLMIFLLKPSTILLKRINFKNPFFMG